MAAVTLAVATVATASVEAMAAVTRACTELASTGCTRRLCSYFGIRTRYGCTAPIRHRTGSSDCSCMSPSCTRYRSFDR